ncbi:MAG: hypothetical protein COA97_03660 [Flavobacteriales bacterium]|nr:MAG: hypothetical protein COA97_03660 [Flavobacteriales bacterium]
MKCKNCKEELASQERFCSNCGQKNIIKLNLKYLLGTFIDDFFNVDSKLIVTLKYLILKPGLLSKEYMEGKRVSFVPPIRLYIVLSVIFFFLISVVDVNEASFDSNSFVTAVDDDGNEVDNSLAMDSIDILIKGEEVELPLAKLREMDYNGTLNNYLDSLTEGTGLDGYLFKRAVKARARGESFFDILYNQISLFLLLFIPLLALLYGICFSANKYGYVGHLVFNIHLNSFIIFILCIDQIVRIFIFSDDIDMVWSIFVFTVGQVYIVGSVMRFYDRKFWVALYKYLFLIIGYFLLALLFIATVFLSSLMLT